MVMMDTLSNAFTTLMANELRGRDECVLSPASKLIGSALRVMQRSGYIGQFEYVDDGRSGKFKVQLLGRINGCAAVKPRYPVKKDELMGWEERYLPSREIGILILSTSQGVINHREAGEKEIGGVLVGYVY